MASGRSANLNKSILLVILMITMTQVGYLESINPWRSGEETLDKTTDLLETGGQGSASYSLGQSTFGEAVALNAAIEPITFEYRENSDAATLYGNGSLWTVNQTSNLIGERISPQRASTGNNSMLNDEVFFFDNGNCDISMHNTSNGTTWEAFALSPCSSSSSSRPFTGRSFFVSGEHFLFQLYDSTQPQQIWATNISNGTSWRIGGGTFSDTSGYLKSQDDLFQHGNDFWFWGYESGSRSQLYRINGSTMEVEARSNFTASCYQCTSEIVRGWAASNGSIYFVVKSTAVGHKAYFHDIATNQTSLAFDINPSGAGVFGLTQVSDNLLFVNGMNTSSSGLKLWAHNTTTNQTYLQSDITPTLIATNPLIDDVYYFYATNTSTGNELHAYSIVNNSTWLVDDIQPGSVGSRPSYSMYQVSPLLQAYEGKLFILADDGTNGDEVWVHDPSTAETYRLTNLGNDVENIQDLVGDTLYFISSKSGYCCYMYAHSMSTNSTYEVPNFPDGRYYQTGARFFLPVNGTIYMNGGHGPSSNNPIQALVAWSPSAITPMTTPVAGATCSVSSTLPFGLALNQGNCTVSGTPTVVTPQSNYTLTATINGQTYGATFWLTTDYLPMRPSVAELEASIGVAITDISFGGFGEPGDGGYGEPFNYNHQSIYAGHDGFCFILETGELRCDGDNYIEGQGPVAVVADVFVEPSLPADAVVKHVLPGSKNHVCAILVNESLYCWGGNTFGQLGNGNYNTQYTPVHIPLPTGRTVEKISADHEFSCALLDNGSIMCWGRNHEGQLGRGTTATSGQNSPGYVSILPQGRHAVDVGVGSEHVCALLDNNDVVCWGANNSMTGSSSITVPQTLSFPSNQSVLSIAAIGKASCALMDNGSVRCWGSNGWYHALGVTGASTTGTPTLTATMPGGLNATALIAHHDGVCATLENFSIACWGAIQYTHVVEPTIPSFPHGSMQITSFAASNNRACYALENGSLWCGTSSTGAGDFIDIESPIQSSLPTLISGATCSISPPLPSGLSLTQGTCKIIGTPTALASNQTYAVFANTTEGTYRGEVNIAVVGEVVDTPIVLLNNSDVDEIAPFYPVTGATYALSPDLPTSMQFDASNGSIWGTPDMLMTNSTYTMWANLTDGTSTLWAFFLEVLEDLDGDGMPDVLPGDYDGSNDPIRSPPGLVEDLDDDGDGYNDTAETDTGLYLDGNNTGTDPRDPDTDDDGICDGPNAVSPICIAGPDLTPFGPPATVVAVNNSMIPSVPPYYAGSGLTYEVMPDLPNGLTIDANNGYLMGIPTETTGNITYTVFANLTDGTSYSWDFTIEVLEDSDGDGSPDTLPADYDGDDDSIRAPPGLTEDLDDDGDGESDLDEIENGTEPLNPDTDGDGFCDGINAVSGVCFAGPDPNPLDPNLPLDTDGDGLPDDDSAWTGPPYADDDDDNDGFPDVSEDACGSDSLDANSIPNDMDGDTICDGDDDDKDGDGIDNVNETGELGVPPGSSPINPDTDGDGICDGPESPVTSNCTAGPDMFPLDPSAWEDTDGDGYPNELFPPSNSTPPLEEDLDDDNDGWTDIDEVNCGSDPVNVTDVPLDLNGDGICDVLDLDWDDDGIPNANETDTGIYNDPSDMGTDPWNPDTDGDGFCDGPFAVFNGTDTVCIGGPDPFPLDPTMPFDTDGDGLPNEMPEDYIGNLEEDMDDDNDGYSDVSELNCDSDPLNASSTPTNDLDGDGICDAQDDDVDGDGLSNVTEQDTNSTSLFNNADTDGDGICDGPLAPAMPIGVCTAGPDAFPNDPAAWIDTDGDGKPDDIVPGIETDLVLDLDDDNDQWADEDEAACGTDPKDVSSTPLDGDDDEICDVLDVKVLGYTMNDQEASIFEGYVNQSDFVILPNLTGMEPGTWTIEPALPAGLSFSGTARSGETGIISGIPTESSNMTNYTVYANNSQTGVQFTFEMAILADTDGDGLPDEGSVTGLGEDLDDDNDGHLDEIEIKCGSDPTNQTSVPNVDENDECITGVYADDDDDDGGFSPLWCLPILAILLLILLLFGLLLRDKVELIGPEPENTTAEPNFLSGVGTKDNPFVLRPIKALKAGGKAETKEAISIINMSPEIVVNLLDLAEATNDKRFMVYEIDGTSEEPGYRLEADEEGRLRIRFVFDDSINPTYQGGDYEGLIKLGKASVYFSWTVGVKQDKKKMNELKKQQEAEEKAAEEKAAKEAEKKAKADEKAAAAAATALAAKEAKEEADAKKKADADAKAAKESEKKAKAEENAAAAALAAKAKEEEDAKKKADADAKAAKEAEEKAAAAKKKAEKKPAATTKEVKKQEELQRVKKRAKSIDFKVIGEATSTKLKSEVKKGSKTLEVGDASEFADSGSAAITDSEGSTLIAWTGKDGNVLTGVSGVTRVFAAASIVMVKDDLQVIKGIGPFLEEKLNALGITTYRQLANMNAKLEEQVNVAIEFFPGRVKRDQWVAQAKILLGEDVKLDEKALKQAEDLERIAQKADGIDFGILGVATIDQQDDLQTIKGIGPFIAEKLYALGIYTFEQVGNMTSEIEEQVNEAIEFFPGRVKRDEWAKQGRELHKKK